MSKFYNPKMAEDACIKPFIHYSDGQCPACSGACYILENEIGSSLLSDNGLPVTYDVEFYSVRAYCVQCNRTFPVIKKGMQFEVVTDEDLFKRLNKVLRGITSYDEDDSVAEDNPFAKGKE